MKLNRYLKNLIQLVTLVIFLPHICYCQGENDSPKLSDPNSYTWVLLPDLQNYQKFERNQPILQLMINWIKDQQKNLNIQMVLCVGDLVDRGNIQSYPGIDKGNQSTIQQWQSLSSSFSKLDNLLPYVLCTGNHDYGEKIAENRYTHFNSFFPPQRNALTQSLLVEMDVNAQGVKTLENACYEWVSPLNQKFLLFSLEFAPRAKVLDWAKSVATRPEYTDHIGVVLTHSYLDTSGVRIAKNVYPLTDMSSGEDIWQKLIKSSGIFRFVLSGHVCHNNEHSGHVGYSYDVDNSNRKVHQILFNAQREGGGHWGNGGDGWLRILEFLPDKKTVRITTFSPLFYISPLTRNLSWRREAYDEFNLSY